MKYVVLPVLKKKYELKMFKADMFDKDTLSFFRNVCGNVGDEETVAELIEEVNTLMYLGDQAKLAEEVMEREDQERYAGICDE